MKLWLGIAMGLVVAQMAAAEAPATRPSTRPTTLPANRQAEIDKLVAKLGDDEPKVRQDASDALRKIGKDALPALAKAKGSEDLEVSTRALSITRQIEDDLKPKSKEPDPAMAGGIHVFGGRGGAVQIRINGGIVVAGRNGAQRLAIARTEANGVKEVTVTENDRTIKIHEDKEGITMSVTEPDKDGKQETKEYKAKDAETLKKEHPEVHTLYEKYSGQGGALQINGLQINGLQIQGLQIQGGDGIRIDVNEQVEQAQKRAEELRKHAEQKRIEMEKRLEEMKKEVLEYNW